MTDIKDWHTLIHRKRLTLSEKEKANFKKLFPEIDPKGTEYVMIPMDTGGYQMGNLLWLLTRHPEDSSGDWYNEIISIIEATCIIEKIVPYSNLEGNEAFNKSINFIKEKIKNE